MRHFASSHRARRVAESRSFKRLSLGLVALAALVACGARTSLEVKGNTTAEGAGPSSGGSDPGGSDPGGFGPSGGAGGVPVLPPCYDGYQPAGEPIVAVELSSQHAISPTLVATNANPDAGPLELAVQYIASAGSGPHDTNGLRRVVVGDVWPDVTLGDLVTVGIESHSYALHALSSDGASMALVWFSDANGVGREAFRTIDVASNTLGPMVDIDAGGYSSTGLAAGAALGASNTEFTGNGYSLTWTRSLSPNMPNGMRQRVMTVLSADGQILTGPHPITPEMQNTVGSAAVWTGSTYVMASAYHEGCPANEPLCNPQEVVITRFRKASGDFVDDSGIDVVASIPSSVMGSQPRRPELVHYDGRTWMVWAEAEAANAGLVVRWVELSPDGTPIGIPQALGKLPSQASHVSALASDQGIAFVWLEPSPNGGGNAAALHVMSMDHEGATVAEMNPLPITQFQGAPVSVAALGGDQRSLVVTWAGAREGGGLDVTYLARLNCIVPFK